MKFYRGINNHYPKRPPAQNRDGSKFKMAAAAILKMTLMAISWSLWLVFAQKFSQGLKTMFYKLFCLQNSLPIKSKMAAAAILKFTLTAITRSLLHLFAQNLAQRRKTHPGNGGTFRFHF